MVVDFGLEIVVAEENQVVVVGTVDIVGRMVVGSKGIDSLIEGFAVVQEMMGKGIVGGSVGKRIVEEMVMVEGMIAWMVVVGNTIVVERILVEVIVVVLKIVVEGILVENLVEGILVGNLVEGELTAVVLTQMETVVVVGTVVVLRHKVIVVILFRMGIVEGILGIAVEGMEVSFVVDTVEKTWRTRAIVLFEG